MFDVLLYIVLLMGPNVLITYVETYRSALVGQLWGGLPRSAWYKNPWVISMILTVVSYLYMSGMWIFDLDDALIYGQEGLQKYVALSYISFMTGAILWAPLSLIALHRGEKLAVVAWALWLTALGSVGMFVLACGLENQPWMIAAATMCMLHHVGFDAVYWWATWDTKQEVLSRADTVPFEDTNALAFSEESQLVY